MNESDNFLRGDTSINPLDCQNWIFTARRIKSIITCSWNANVFNLRFLKIQQSFVDENIEKP